MRDANPVVRNIPGRLNPPTPVGDVAVDVDVDVDVVVDSAAVSGAGVASCREARLGEDADDVPAMNGSQSVAVHLPSYQSFILIALPLSSSGQQGDVCAVGKKTRVYARDAGKK